MRVAICICTCDRPRSLERLLQSLRNIALGGRDPDDLQVIVVDNRPNPETAALCKRMHDVLPMDLHYVEEPQPGVSHARNRAVATALERGADLLALVDDDDVPRPDWLAALLDRQAQTGADLVFGVWTLDDAMPEWARQTGLFQPPGKNKLKGDRGRYGLPRGASTGNVLIRREILERAGVRGEVFSHVFGDSGGEDKDFFLRALQLGAQLTTTDKSVVECGHEPDRYTVRGLFRRGFKNGCSTVNMARVHGAGADVPGPLARLIVPGLLLSALGKLALVLMLLPASLFSRGFFMHNLYRAAKACGVLYSGLTGLSLRYYSR